MLDFTNPSSIKKILNELNIGYREIKFKDGVLFFLQTL